MEDPATNRYQLQQPSPDDPRKSASGEELISSFTGESRQQTIASIQNPQLYYTSDNDHNNQIQYVKVQTLDGQQQVLQTSGNKDYIQLKYQPIAAESTFDSK